MELGGQAVVTDGRSSVTDVQRSFPGATVTVYNAGTLVLATIYSDVLFTPKANPFVADSTGYWGFFAEEGSYDVQFSGAGIPSPFSLLNWRILATAGIPDPGSNGIIVRTALNTVVARTIQGTTSEIIVTNGNGVAGNPTISLSSFLEFTGKTINGGTYISPGISNFQSAQHNHESATGGGQLNATNVFSTGTVPISRLPVFVGATGVSAGVEGLVPAPAAGQQNLFLRGDGSWQSTGGGGGIPGSPNGSLQYNNAGAFGGVSGGSSDGTNAIFTSGTLRATSPRITTSVFDADGNVIVALSPVGSAVNQITLANAAMGGAPVISATGSDTNINIVLTPKGTGINFTSGNIQISNNAPQLVLTDVNDSKQARIVLNGSSWQWVNDTAGQTPISIDTTNSDITTVGNLFFAKAGTITIGRPSQLDLQLSNTTGVYTFGQIPELPASNPTTSNQAVRKAYVDGKKTAFSFSWFIDDPSTFPVATQDLPKFICPEGTSITLTKSKVVFSNGSHTSGGDVRFNFQQRTASSTWTSFTNFGLIALNNTNNTQNVVYEVDFGDVVLSAGDTVLCFIDFRGGTITERDVTIALIGTQLLT